jgi:aspartate kinase
MRALVMKFGGSSVVDAAAISRVITIVSLARERERAPVVVVSALGGTTDRLLGLADAASRGQDEAVREGLFAVSQRHTLEAASLGLDGNGELAGAMTAIFDELRATLDGVRERRAADPPALDVIAAAGELLSSLIVSAAMAARGLPATWIDARDVIVTDDRYTCAAPLSDDIGTAARAIVAPLVGSRVPVMGGFIGRSTSGTTTTLGRGGSDYSASLLGAAIGAEEIQIWTDVDGMLTADPRIVDDAEIVKYLSFAEAAELAYFGAKVLHPATIFPAVSRNIPVRILNSHRPDGQGTLIVADPPPAHRPFAALASKRGITVIDITSSRMLMSHGFLRRVFEVFDVHETSVDVVTTSEVSVSVTIDDNRHAPAIVASLLEIAEVNVEEQMAILAVVGDRLAIDSSLAARVLGSLRGFPLRMLSQAASRRNVTIVLPQSYLFAAMSHLHKELFAVAEPAS